MPVLQDLSTELLYNIAEYLNEKQIYVLIQQSRLFYKIFIPLLYSVIDDRNALLPLNQFENNSLKAKFLSKRVTKLNNFITKVNVFIENYNDKELNFEFFDNVVEYNEKITTEAQFNKLLELDNGRFKMLKTYRIIFHIDIEIDITKLGNLVNHIKDLSLAYYKLTTQQLNAFFNPNLKNLSLTTFEFDRYIFQAIESNFPNIENLNLNGIIHLPIGFEVRIPSVKYISIKGKLPFFRVFELSSQFFPNLISLHLQGEAFENPITEFDTLVLPTLLNLKVLKLYLGYRNNHVNSTFHKKFIISKYFPKLEQLYGFTTNYVDLSLWSDQLQVLGLSPDMTVNISLLSPFTNLRVLTTCLGHGLCLRHFQALFTDLVHLKELTLLVNAYFDSLPLELFEFTPTAQLLKLSFYYKIDVHRTFFNFLTKFTTLQHLHLHFTPFLMSIETYHTISYLIHSNGNFDLLKTLALFSTPGQVKVWFLKSCPNLLSLEDDKSFTYNPKLYSPTSKELLERKKHQSDFDNLKYYALFFFGFTAFLTFAILPYLGCKIYTNQ